jgi:1,2-diacylglycerol 3-beta-glucosyltransferase
MPAAASGLFQGLPIPLTVLFWLALVVIVGMFAWTLLLFVAGWGEEAEAPVALPDEADRFAWVFFVPALNEELTIRDSVARLLALPVAQRHVIVIDDASDDRTAELLGEIDHPDLVVLSRTPPEARRGKAAALNYAYRALGRVLGAVDRSAVIVVIVDADGRLHPAAPRYVAAQFADRSVGGVQSLVRIYNKRRWLTWCQDVEFSVYGHLFQAGRNHWGTAGMGGNGQFNRLSALDDLADSIGPWRDRLTEDQDLGLRLSIKGWKGRQELRAAVDQQGPVRVGALFRQRTRWSQGNLQALSLTRDLLGAPLPAAARVELLVYLLMPLWQAIVGVCLVAAIVLAALGRAHLWYGGPTSYLVFVYVLALGGTVLGCVASRRSGGIRGWVSGFLIGHVYALYSWLIWPVLARSIARQLTHRQNWSKTAREPLAETFETPAAVLPLARAAREADETIDGETQAERAVLARS